MRVSRILFSYGSIKSLLFIFFTVLFAYIDFIYYLCTLNDLNMKNDVILGSPLNGGTEV